MSIEIKLIFDDLEEFDVSTYAFDDFKILQACFNSEFKHVRNTCALDVVLTSALHNKLLNNTGWIDFTFKDGATDIFTGIISPSISSKVSNGLDYINLDAMDYTEVMDISIPESFSITGGKLYDSTTPALSAVHALASLITSRTISVMTGAADFTIPFLVFKKGDKVSKVLEELLFNYGFQYWFDSSGVLQIAKWNTGTTTTSETIGDDGASVIDGSFSINKKENSDSSVGSDSADSVESYFRKVEIVTGALVGSYDYITVKSAGGYLLSSWVSANSVNSNDQGDWNNYAPRDVCFNTSEDFPAATDVFHLDYHRLDSDEIADITLKWANIEFWPTFYNGEWGDGTGSRYKLNTRGHSIFSVLLDPAGSHTKNVKCDIDGVDYSMTITALDVVKNNFSEWKVTFEKTGSGNYIILKRIALYGDVIIKRPEVKIQKPGPKENYIKIDNTYIFEEDFAQAFAEMYRENVLASAITYTFNSYQDYDIGTNCQITFAEKGLSTKAKILKKEYQYKTREYTYELKGLTAVTVPVVTTPTTNYPKPGPIGVLDDGTVFGVIEGALIPDNVTPQQTGLTFTRERFGYYDADTDTWTAYTDNEGDMHMSGLIDSGQGIESSNFETGISGFKINGAGDAEFNNLVVRGDIKATSRTTIQGRVVDGGLQSDDYVSNSQGWKLPPAGGIIGNSGGVFKSLDFHNVKTALSIGTLVDHDTGNFSDLINVDNVIYGTVNNTLVSVNSSTGAITVLTTYSGSYQPRKILNHKNTLILLMIDTSVYGHNNARVEDFSGHVYWSSTDLKDPQWTQSGDYVYLVGKEEVTNDVYLFKIDVLNEIEFSKTLLISGDPYVIGIPIIFNNHLYFRGYPDTKKINLDTLAISTAISSWSYFEDSWADSEMIVFHDNTDVVKYSYNGTSFTSVTHSSMTALFYNIVRINRNWLLMGSNLCLIGTDITDPASFTTIAYPGTYDSVKFATIDEATLVLVGQDGVALAPISYSFKGDISGEKFKATETPTAAEDLTRKDYVDAINTALTTVINAIKPLLKNTATFQNNTSDPTNDIDFLTIKAMDTTGVYLFNSASTFTKRLDANFTAGNNQGGLDAGSKANSTWYACWAIAKADGTEDRLFSLSGTAPTMPTGYIYKAFMRWVYVQSSGVILPFTQYGDYIEYKTTQVVRAYAVDSTTTEQTFTVTFCPPLSKAKLSISTAGANATGWIKSAGFTNATPTDDNSNINFATGARVVIPIEVNLDSSRQAKRRHTNSGCYIGIQADGYELSI